jgi:hypothetical protein
MIYQLRRAAKGEAVYKAYFAAIFASVAILVEIGVYTINAL